MRGIRHEEAHYTRQQVKDHVSDAIAVLQEHNLDHHDHPELLVAVYNSLAAKSITVEQVEVAPGGVGLLGIPRGNHQ